MTAEIDRWIPDYASHGYSHVEAQRIASRAEALLAATPAMEWTEALRRAVAVVDARARYDAAIARSLARWGVVREREELRRAVDEARAALFAAEDAEGAP